MLEINQSNKRHAWETACTYRTQSPLLYYEEMAVWLIDPTQCAGVFVIQGSPGGGSDLAGGSLQGLPAHLSKEVVHGLGDLRSAVQLERVCRETRELVTSPDVWIGRHAGVLPAAAVDANWLGDGKSLLAAAIGGSRIVAVDWPVQATEKCVCCSVTRKWSMRQPTLSPVYFRLGSTDQPQRVVISIGGCSPAGDRCWCDIIAPFADTVVIELGHTRLGRPSDKFVTNIPECMAGRLLQIQWYNHRLEVFLDGHGLGMLSLQDCDVQQWAQVAVSVFGEEDSALYHRNMSSSCFLPTELCTKFFLSALDLRGGTLNLLSVTPLQVSFLGSLQDFLRLASCSKEFREYVQQGDFWHSVDLELKDRLLVSFRQPSLGTFCKRGNRGRDTFIVYTELQEVVLPVECKGV